MFDRSARRGEMRRLVETLQRPIAAIPFQDAQPAWIMPNVPVALDRQSECEQAHEAQRAVVAYDERRVAVRARRQRTKHARSSSRGVLKCLAVGRGRAGRSGMPGKIGFRLFGAYLLVRAALPRSIVEIGQIHGRHRPALWVGRRGRFQAARERAAEHRLEAEAARQPGRRRPCLCVPQVAQEQVVTSTKSGRIDPFDMAMA